MSAEEITIDGVVYVPKGAVVADRVAIHGMYDCHAFHPVTGKTVADVIDDWLKHNAKPDTRYGPSMLCPAIVLRGDTEIRRVGDMIFWKDRYRDLKPALDAYVAALLADPDIPRLLAGEPAPVKKLKNSGYLYKASGETFWRYATDFSTIRPGEPYKELVAISEGVKP